MSSPLALTAVKMLNFASHNAYAGGSKQPYHKQLPRGLGLTCWCSPTHYHLIVARKGEAPSEAELKVCRVVFGVPIAYQKEAMDYTDAANRRGKHFKWPIDYAQHQPA